jgi:hypothetical protein
MPVAAKSEILFAWEVKQWGDTAFIVTRGIDDILLGGHLFLGELEPLGFRGTPIVTVQSWMRPQDLNAAADE